LPSRPCPRPQRLRPAGLRARSSLRPPFYAEPERRPDALLRHESHLAAVRFDETFRDVQAEPGARRRAGELSPGELVEDRLLLALRDPGPLIGDSGLAPVSVRPEADDDLASVGVL